MDDYIKREDAIMLLKLSPTIESAEDEIRGYPAADVRKNVRGEWIVDEKRFPQGVDWCHCSECGYRDITQNVPSINFCPNCGADMRKEVSTDAGQE